MPHTTEPEATTQPDTELEETDMPNETTEPYKQEKVAKAFETIKVAMQADCPECHGSYAHSWHCNIAMACFDAIKAHDVTALDEYSGEISTEDAHAIGNDAASRFMRMCFSVNTKA